jgi:hypothetical protein
VPAALELGDDDLVHVEEAVLLEADLDEGRLHPGQDVVDGAEVDVAGDRALAGSLEVDLGDAVVLEHGDALLEGGDGDEGLALRRRAGAPLRLDAATALAGAAAAAIAVGPALGRLALGLGGLVGLRLLRLLGGGRRGRLGLCLARGLAGTATPAAGAATALGTGCGGVGAALSGRRGLPDGCGSGCLDRRRLGLLLAQALEDRTQTKTPCEMRARARPPRRGGAARSR